MTTTSLHRLVQRERCTPVPDHGDRGSVCVCLHWLKSTFAFLCKHKGCHCKHRYEGACPHDTHTGGFFKGHRCFSMLVALHMKCRGQLGFLQCVCAWLCPSLLQDQKPCSSASLILVLMVIHSVVRGGVTVKISLLLLQPNCVLGDLHKSWKMLGCVIIES